MIPRRLAILTLVALTGCVGSDRTPEPTLVVGAVLPLSGPGFVAGERVVHLEAKQAQQVSYLVSVAYPGQLQDIFVEVGTTDFTEKFRSLHLTSPYAHCTITEAEDGEN